jgi:hypothetical protein
MMRTTRLAKPAACGLFLVTYWLGPIGALCSSVTPVRHWKGQWIWCGGEAKPYHLYLFARRSFELAEKQSTAALHITASDRYALFVNGTYLGRGPARSDPRRKSYDTFDVAAHLNPGKNTIAVRAYHYGTPREEGWSGNGYTVGERAGLWVQLNMNSPSGQRETIGTDSQWRLRQANAWNRKAQLINVLVGSTEVFDASADPVNWMSVDFDDSAWESALVIPQRSQPWVLLEARNIPMMQEREVFPTRIVKVGEVIDQGFPRQTNIPDLLNEEQHLVLENAIARNPDAVLKHDGHWAEFQGKFALEKGIRAPYLIVDFGRQLFGFPRIRLNAEQGAMLDMTYGQQLQAGRIPAALRYGDRYISRQGGQTWEVAEYKQFRYLHLTLRSTDSPIRIESVSVNEYRYPAERRGRFGCSDPLLTKLWKACADTTYLHMEDSIVCDAYRERVPWSTGDGSHGIHGIYAAYGDLPLTDRFLRSFPLSDRGDGMLQMGYPPDNPWHYNIPQFLLQWSTRVREHYLHSGRRAVLEELYPSVQRQIDWYAPHRDEAGLLRDLPHWNFMDWTPNDIRGASFTTNALYLNGLEDAAWLADAIGQSRDALRWKRIAEKVRAGLRRMFWNEQKGIYEDSHHGGGLTGVASEMANGCALLYDVATPQQAARIAQGFANEGTNLVEVSPLYFGYVLDGLYKAGFAQKALDLMRARFAPQLQATDSPTIWEGWGPFTGSQVIDSDENYLRRSQLRPAGVRSLVHSGGVLAGYVLSTRVLGVMPTAAGFSKCVIYPRLGDLQWAKGAFPAPQGDIEVECRQERGKLILNTKVPKGIEAQLVFGRDPQVKQTLTHNGVRLNLDTKKATKQQTRVVLEPGTIRLPVQPGNHTVELINP